jgi:hypothetical protein
MQTGCCLGADRSARDIYGSRRAFPPQVGANVSIILSQLVFRVCLHGVAHRMAALLAEIDIGFHIEQTFELLSDTSCPDTLTGLFPRPSCAYLAAPPVRQLVMVATSRYTYSSFANARMNI